MKPYLVYQAEATVTFWMPGAFSKETAKQVLEGTKKVVNDSHGTGYAAHRDDIVLAGKTGTERLRHQRMILQVRNWDGLLSIRQRKQWNILY